MTAAIGNYIRDIPNDAGEASAKSVFFTFAFNTLSGAKNPLTAAVIAGVSALVDAVITPIINYTLGYNQNQNALKWGIRQVVVLASAGAALPLLGVAYKINLPMLLVMNFIVSTMTNDGFNKASVYLG